MTKNSPVLNKYISKLLKVTPEKDYEYFYRGHTERVKQILPRIYRKEQQVKYERINQEVSKPNFGKSYIGRDITSSIIENEDRIFREIILHSPQEFIDELTAIEKLVKMQHYGLPTRLLDITLNPLVALYFACINRTGNNIFDIAFNYTGGKGEVVILKIHKDEIKFFDSDTVSILANVSKMKWTFVIPEAEKKDEFNESGDIPLLLHEIRGEKPHFSPVIEKEDFNRVLPVKVKLSNDRIIKQNGAFLLFGMDKKKENSAKIKEDWIHHRITVAETDKAAIIKELNILGINESSLFPEIEYQAKHLVELYSIKS